VFNVFRCRLFTLQFRLLRFTLMFDTFDDNVYIHLFTLRYVCYVRDLDVRLICCFLFTFITFVTFSLRCLRCCLFVCYTRFVTLHTTLFIVTLRYVTFVIHVSFVSVTFVSTRVTLHLRCSVHLR